jgi:hypothetical protein
MLSLDVLGLDFFHGYKAHGWTAHRLTDGRGIMGIVLMALAAGRHTLGAHETDIMPQRAHRPRPVAGPLAGRHTDTTWGELRHTRQELRACQWLTDDHMPLRIYAVELQDGFCQIDPEYCNLHGWTPLLRASWILLSHVLYKDVLPRWVSPFH